MKIVSHRELVGIGMIPNPGIQLAENVIPTPRLYVGGAVGEAVFLLLSDAPSLGAGNYFVHVWENSTLVGSTVNLGTDANELEKLAGTGDEGNGLTKLLESTLLEIVDLFANDPRKIAALKVLADALCSKKQLHFAEATEIFLNTLQSTQAEPALVSLAERMKQLSNVAHNGGLGDLEFDDVVVP